MSRTNVTCRLLFCIFFLFRFAEFCGHDISFLCFVLLPPFIFLVEFFWSGSVSFLYHYLTSYTIDIFNRYCCF